MLTPNLKCKNSRIEFIFILSFVVEVLDFAYNFSLKYNLKGSSSIFQIIIMANAFWLVCKTRKNTLSKVPASFVIYVLCLSAFLLLLLPSHFKLFAFIQCNTILCWESICYLSLLTLLKSAYFFGKINVSVALLSVSPLISIKQDVDFSLI